MPRLLFAALAALVLALPAHAGSDPGAELDDTAITAQVKAALIDHKDTHATRINVETYRGIVQLSGFVTTEAEQATAARVAGDVEGVREVRNSIALHPATSLGTRLDDTVLTGRVKAALMDSADVKSAQINVESAGGVVQLAGFVTGEGMKRRALEIAAGIQGVQRVDDALIVKPR